MITSSIRENIFKIIMAVMLGVAKSIGMTNFQINNLVEKKIESNK
ncbi:MAG: hypothetical protein ABIE43_05355 [Patescibacteria group bacterium]